MKNKLIKAFTAFFFFLFILGVLCLDSDSIAPILLTAGGSTGLFWILLVNWDTLVRRYR